MRLLEMNEVMFKWILLEEETLAQILAWTQSDQAIGKNKGGMIYSCLFTCLICMIQRQSCVDLRLLVYSFDL
jgi:hypothetical protein